MTVVLTGDHGIAPIAAEARAAGLPAGAFPMESVREAAEEALDAALGAETWVAAAADPCLWLDLDAIGRRKADRARAEEIAAAAAGKVEGVYAAYTRTQILSGRMPATAIARLVAEGFHPRVSGDVVIVPDPFWVVGSHMKGAAHGSPYAYDTAVPILLGGAGIRRAKILDRVTVLDIAPTLAALLGILPPSGSEGRILAPALSAE